MVGSLTGPHYDLGTNATPRCIGVRLVLLVVVVVVVVNV